ncbi:hypothetical protein [Blastococcus brunescens]|uniref:DUF402 domain-containing protein n=1 Tax=Blastococcus brunescens TaxID=1564165 RepID=A0ABZ1B3A7_9ACTN|nr:hypothetical protein [Blastococcus sp. BMG 8361]WRL65291.1 hypothetical protein U6N30_06455 [Blastococcus sp. BMG 8361]
MGYFGKLAYSDGRWTFGGPTAVPFLLVDVHDSDVATIDYRSVDASGGRFYLGYEPRIYFEEPDAGDPVDTQAEAQGFTRWVKDAAGTDVDPDDVRRLMAAPDGAPPAEDVVEEAVEKLLALAGLPLPEWPTDEDMPAG